MDPLLILIQLEVLVQLKNSVSQFHNPTLQFISDSWIQITRMRIFFSNCSLRGKGLNPFIRNKVFDRNMRRRIP